MKSFSEISKNLCGSNDTNFVLYCDTDSLYVHAHPFLDKLYPDFNSYDESKKEDILEEEAIKYQNLVNSYYDEMAKENFNCQKNHFFEMKTEAVISSAYFRKTRRYAQWIKKKEGVTTDELDIKGLEFKKTNFPLIFGDFIYKILEQILKGAHKEEIDSQIFDFKKMILDGNFSIEELGNPTAIKTLNKYLESPPKDGEIFSTTKLRAPAPVKASIVYNDLVKFWGLNKEGHSYLVQGDKIVWVYLKDNPYKIEAIAFIKGLVPPKIKELIEQHINYEKIFESVLLNKIKGLYEDLGWKLMVNPHIYKFFSF